MNLYLVLRTDIRLNGRDYPSSILKVELLEPKKHIISHNGVAIPITVGFDTDIDKDTVTIHISHATGPLDSVSSGSMPDDWDFSLGNGIKSITFFANTIRPPVIIARDSNQCTMSLEWHEISPKVFSFPR